MCIKVEEHRTATHLYCPGHPPIVQSVSTMSLDGDNDTETAYLEHTHITYTAQTYNLRCANRAIAPKRRCGRMKIEPISIGRALEGQNTYYIPWMIQHNAVDLEVKRGITNPRTDDMAKHTWQCTHSKNRKYLTIILTAAVSQSVDLGQNNNPNTTPTKDYENVRVVVYLRGVQRGCAEEGESGSTPTG